jgi:hypothetical protein
MQFDQAHDVPDHFAVGFGEGMVRFNFTNGLVNGVVLELSEVEGDHLRRAVDAGGAVHVHLLAVPDEVPHHPESSGCPTHEVLVVHVEDGVFLVFDVVLLADELQVVRGKTVPSEVLLALDREDRRDVVLF